MALPLAALCSVSSLLTGWHRKNSETVLDGACVRLCISAMRALVEGPQARPVIAPGAPRLACRVYDLTLFRWLSAVPRAAGLLAPLFELFLALAACRRSLE